VNTIHATAIIDDGVELGTNNVIGPYVVISGPVSIGDDNWIGAGSIIGAAPEVRQPSTGGAPIGGPPGAGIRIGDRNVIREAVQIHSGWKSITSMGDDCYIMNQSYLAHDCRIGDHVTIASSALLAGHVSLEDGVNLGLGSKVHQFRHIGRLAMIGMGGIVTRDVPPFAKAFGSPARVHDVNTVGMQRADFSEQAISTLARLYREPSGSTDAISELTPHDQGLIGVWLDDQRSRLTRY
jgi:UDP-N-acetylglucosamine acyltransferase